MRTPNENCENSENGFGLWLGRGVFRTVKIVKMVRMVWSCGWDVGWVTLPCNNSENGENSWVCGFGVGWVPTVKIVKKVKVVRACSCGAGLYLSKRLTIKFDWALWFHANF